MFVYAGDKVPAALRPFRAQPYSWELHVQRELGGAGEKHVASKPAAKMSSAARANYFKVYSAAR